MVDLWILDTFPKSNKKILLGGQQDIDLPNEGLLSTTWPTLWAMDEYLQYGPNFWRCQEVQSKTMPNKKEQPILYVFIVYAVL